MEYVVGVGLAAGICSFARLVGFDRDRAFYVAMVLVVATYYILFAVMGGSISALLAESGVALVFFVLAAVGFKKSPILIAATLAGHGVYDFFHRGLIANPGVPAWWPGFCLSFDICAGAFLAALLHIRSRSPQLP